MEHFILMSSSNSSPFESNYFHVPSNLLTKEITDLLENWDGADVSFIEYTLIHGS